MVVPPREVARVALQFVQDELLRYVAETRAAGAVVRATLGEAANKKTEPNKIPPSIITASQDAAATLLEELGYNMGIKLCERLLVLKERMRSQRDCVKFICKELWICAFGKQADRLQTNRKGGYVILENNFRPLIHVLPGQISGTIGSSLNTSDRQALLASACLIHTCGLIRGALLNIGYASTVTAESENPPVCLFKIDLEHQPELF